MNSPGAPAGLRASLRRMADTLLGLAQVRLELLASELEQEKLRLLDALLKAALGLLLVGLSLVLGLAFVVMLLQEGYRLPALGVLTLLLGAAGVLLLRHARAGVQGGRDGLFALSRDELRNDRAALQPGSDAAPAGPRRDEARSTSTAPPP